MHWRLSIVLPNNNLKSKKIGEGNFLPPKFFFTILYNKNQFEAFKRR